MKRRLLLAVGLLVGLAGAAMAGIPSDTFQITFTPTGSRGVIISSDSAPIALGSLALGTTTQTAAIPVISTGTIGITSYQMSGVITSGGTPATFTARTSTQPATTEVCVQGQFCTAAPAVWGGSNNNITTSAVNVGSATKGYYVDPSLTTTMDDMALNVSNNLWVRLMLPATASYSALQTITVTITAQAGY